MSDGPIADPAFAVDPEGLQHAINLLSTALRSTGGLPDTLPDTLPTSGLGERGTLDLLAPLVLGGAQHLGESLAFAHMDPPTPWVSWATTLWTASVNQNLLHPDTAPVARDIEARVMAWLAPLFGQDGGHMTSGSTVANLTALWAARETGRVRRVIGSQGAHLSVPKAAHIHGLPYEAAPTGPDGRLDQAALPDSLDDVCLVLTAGATSTGAVDPLSAGDGAAWLHVDAAWAGPLRLSDRYAAVLAGVERVDSVAVSAHKWLFQPKESALILFRDAAASHASVSFGGAYLTDPNIGVLGSHGAMAVPLLATLLAFGRTGLAARIERCMAAAHRLWQALSERQAVELFGEPQTGVLLWRPRGRRNLDRVYGRLPSGMTSRTVVGDAPWFRQVAANPNAEPDRIVAAIDAALG